MPTPQLHGLSKSKNASICTVICPHAITSRCLNYVAEGWSQCTSSVLTVIFFTPLEAKGEGLDLVSGTVIKQRTARPTLENRNRNLRAKYRPIEAVEWCEPLVCKNQIEHCRKQIFCRAELEQGDLTFRYRASCILGQAFHYSPENTFYIFHYLIFAWLCIIDINNIDNQLDATITAY